MSDSRLDPLGFLEQPEDSRPSSLSEKLHAVRNYNFSWTVEGPALGHIINCHELMLAAEAELERLTAALETSNVGDLYLQEIEARANAATFGPWIRSGVRAKTPGVDCIWVGREDFSFVALPIGATGKEQAAALRDGDFIAHAREDIPALVAEVKRLTTSLQEVAEVGSGWGGRKEEEAKFGYSATTGEGHQTCRQIADAALEVRS